jgi:hypothetical protein
MLPRMCGALGLEKVPVSGILRGGTPVGAPAEPRPRVELDDGLDGLRLQRHVVDAEALGEEISESTQDRLPVVDAPKDHVR